MVEPFDEIRRVEPVVVLGEFDGFHLGHRQLVSEALEIARDRGRPLVGVVLNEAAGPPVLLTPQRRCWAMVAAGASAATVLEIESNPVGPALVEELCDRFRPAIVVLACPQHDHGHRYPFLRQQLVERAVSVIEVPRWSNPDGAVVTSERIRQALLAADVPAANDWLGREFSLSGLVVHGSGLGRTIGFPTANLSLASELLVPKRGVYAATVRLANGEHRPSAVNIGVRPTVEADGAVLVEAHLLDFDGDLYDQTITVAFRRWLRDERRFTNVDELIDQLRRDVQLTRIVVRR